MEKYINEIIKCFDKSIESVNEFYLKCDLFLSDIETQKNGEIDTVKFLKTLKDFYDSHLLKFSLPTEENKKSFDYLKNNNCKLNDFSSVNSFVRALKNDIHLQLNNNSDWNNRDLHISLIGIILEDRIKNSAGSKTNQIQFLSTIRILKELISDCALYFWAFEPLCEFTYGTQKYSLLDAERQLSVLLNQAIITDRMFVFVFELEVLLDRLYKSMKSFTELSWEVYYVAGLLNFKIHQYDKAKEYFEKVESNNQLLLSTISTEQDKYFHAVLLIAYSLEYKQQFDKSLEKLCVPVRVLYSLFEDIEFSEIENFFDDKLNKINIEAHAISKESLFSLYFDDNVPIRSQLSQKGDNYKRQLEILHAFAHSLNEYSIDQYNKSNNSSTEESCVRSKILRFARMVMKMIAELSAGYWTCHAEIFGEYKDYNRALIELDYAEAQIKQCAPDNEKESLLAEVAFFKYYFSTANSLQLNIGDKYKKEFRDYYLSNDDDDAECYIKIFEFRNEMRVFISKFFQQLSECDSNTKLIDDISQDLEEKYYYLCKLTPSLYMNANVRSELRLMQRTYICIQRLIKLIKDNGTMQSKPSDNHLLNFANACSRFSNTKIEVGLSDTIKCITPIDVFFDETMGVVHCLFNSDSIFILAPISGVVVFQYQTGKINKLFDKNSILPIKPKISQSLSFNKNTFVEKYGSICNALGLPFISGIDWNKCTILDTVYAWSPLDKNRLLIARKDNFGRTEIRRLDNPTEFEKTINKVNSQTKQPCTRPDNNNMGRICKITNIEIKWLEMVNESSNLQGFFVLRNGDTWGDYFIFKCNSNLGQIINQHLLHSSVLHVGIQFLSCISSKDSLQEKIYLYEAKIKGTCTNIISECKRKIESDNKIKAISDKYVSKTGSCSSIHYQSIEEISQIQQKFLKYIFNESQQIEVSLNNFYEEIKDYLNHYQVLYEK